MISVTEAKDIIKSNIKLLPSVLKPIDEAVGFVLDETIVASINVPSFRQSSMDGYAFAHEAIQQYTALDIVEVMQAGSNKQIAIKHNQAVRIFTGAPLPEGADTIFMQEKAVIENGQLKIDAIDIQLGANARAIGADIQQGAVALEKGSFLTPACIGFLASIGITKLSVINKPRVQIIVTGNELQTVGKELSIGQIYESNSHTLLAALHQLGINQVEVVRVQDDLSSITNTLATALEEADLILITGGVSVGDYDFVVEATSANQVSQLFHKIKQKPGKPFYIGLKGEKVVCGLPGNPASVLSCFYNYITLVLDRLSGTHHVLPNIKAILKNDFKKPAGLTHFLKGEFEFLSDQVNDRSMYQVTILDGQESFKMKSFALANCFVELPEYVTEVRKGEEVWINLFPR
jgi:molybdopterin molybdotransferase